MERMASDSNDARHPNDANTKSSASGLISSSNVSFANSIASTSTDATGGAQHSQSDSISSTSAAPAPTPLTHGAAPAMEAASENGKRKAPHPQTAKQMYNSVSCFSIMTSAVIHTILQLASFYTSHSVLISSKI